jgi:RNA polymerase sigma factor (sigma-70 family)
VSAPEARATIDAIWRIEAPTIIGGLTRMLRDVGSAEDLAHDALVAALEQWPREGVPVNPGAWLMATAKHRAIDRLRRHTRFAQKLKHVGAELERAQETAPDYDTALDDEVGDDLLRLIFTSCHPVVPREARVALTLRLLGGLTTEEIARAFLVPAPTMAQRLVRAKKTLAKANVPFEVPGAAERAERLSAVLEVVYLVFNEGYAASSGATWVRQQLCDEAMRLGRVLAGLMPEEAEVHGLVALMELQASRFRARTAPTGEPVLLLDQDRGRWDHLLIRRGLTALARAQQSQERPGPYTVQAGIAACHSRARTAAETDWAQIVRLYDDLLQLTPSPVVELNRAVAVTMARGPAEGLRIVDELVHEPALATYHYVSSVRADLLQKLGRLEEARREFERAAGMTQNEQEKQLLLARAARIGRVP